MRVDPIPPIPLKSMPAFRTYLPLGADLALADQTGILFKQSQSGMPNKLGWRNAIKIGDLCQPGLLLRSELHFHT
jgi:hypothetical protein